jgi:hypothetical protein
MVNTSNFFILHNAHEMSYCTMVINVYGMDLQWLLP